MGPREQNKIPDNLSRYSDCDDWGMNVEVFDILDELWGKHFLDRFATDNNSKCFRFNLKYWYKGTETNWLAPPPNFVYNVIRKVCDDRAQSSLVVPFWKSAPFWALLKLRMEMGNVSKRQQTDHRTDNSRRSPIGL